MKKAEDFDENQENNISLSGNNTGLFITTGNITIADNATVKGLCIAGFKCDASGNRTSNGKITLGKRASIQSAPAYIEDIYRNAASYRTKTKGTLFNSIFKGFEYDSTAGSYTPLDSTEGTVINLNKMFAYENWSKQ